MAPEPRFDRGEAPVRVLGDVQRPREVDCDGLPGVQVRQGPLDLGARLEDTDVPVLVDPLDVDDEAGDVGFDREATPLISGERDIDGKSLNAGPGV